MAETPTPVEVFCCYSHADEPWLRKLEIHLSLLQRQGLISFWHDRLIAPGTKWAQAIDQHLETASVILLLVSADFLASDYCYSVEMKRALERQEAGEARVIPILVRPADWKNAPFAHLQVLPTDAKPLSTWRMQETVLANITAGIRRVIEDVPLLAASAPHAALPPIWNIPYPRNPFFLGRDTELALVRHHLQGGQATALSQPQAISGLGGIGKTQLALEYAYRYHQDYQTVLWAWAESTEALISSYIAIATLLRLPEHKVKEQDITVQAVKIWLQTHRDWLLILDNADDLTLLPDFLPPSLGGHLLLTTRAAATGRLAHRLEIEILPPEMSALFLLRRAALIAPDATLEQVSQEERELTLQISQELGGLPLALDQAGAYLEETGTDLASYWQIYQRHRTDLLKQRGGLVADHPAPVATTWSLSFQRVEEKNPAAAELLRLCTFLSPDAIPEEILTEGASFLGPMLALVAADTFLLNQAIEALRAYSLVRCDPRGKTLSVHRLVQAVLQESLESNEQQLWAQRAILAVNASFPNIESSTRPQCERLISHALHVVQRIETNYVNRLEAGYLLYKSARYLDDYGHYPYDTNLRSKRQSLPDAEASLAATARDDMRLIPQSASWYENPEPLYQRALLIMEQWLGPEHLDVALPINGLADLYRAQGKSSEAEPLYQRVLHIREQQGGPNHPLLGSPLKSLAHIYFFQGKYIEAELLFLRALHIWEQQGGPNHPLLMTPLRCLATIYFHQGKYAEAEPLYQRALHIREQQVGPGHPLLAAMLTNLATVYFYQGRYAEAEPLFMRALCICWEQQGGVDNYDVANSYIPLGWLNSYQGRYTESLEERNSRIREQMLEPDYPLLGSPLFGWMLLYSHQGKYPDREALSRQIEQLLEPDSHETAETISDLAKFREAQDNSE